jgi:cob(I)alamin adenosyltransferase
VKIYTRTGDRGETALFGGGRVAKNDVRVAAYGDVDEANSALGLAIVAVEAAGMADTAENLRLVQRDLFAIGAHLATPGAVRGDAASRHLPDSPVGRVPEMERWIDEAEDRVEPLRAFVLPGGSEAAARLHLARALCRRAERSVVSLAQASPVDDGIIVYLNRLSDLLFVLARVLARADGGGEVLWDRSRTQ